jgi:hypothetical protein
MGGDPITIARTAAVEKWTSFLNKYTDLKWAPTSRQIASAQSRRFNDEIGLSTTLF